MARIAFCIFINLAAAGLALSACQDDCAALCTACAQPCAGGEACTSSGDCCGSKMAAAAVGTGLRCSGPNADINTCFNGKCMTYQQAQQAQQAEAAACDLAQRQCQSGPGSSGTTCGTDSNCCGYNKCPSRGLVNTCYLGKCATAATAAACTNLAAKCAQGQPGSAGSRCTANSDCCGSAPACMIAPSDGYVDQCSWGECMTSAYKTKLAAATLPYTTPAPTVLTTGKKLTSTNGQYFMIVQADGNVVIYTSAGGVKYSFKTGAANVATGVFVDATGRLTITRVTAAGTPAVLAFRSTTTGTVDTTTLRAVLQDDGNLVCKSGSVVHWATF